MELNKKFIVNLQGKEFVTFNGLMDMAHQIGLQSITTELIQIPTEENNNVCIAKAVVTTEDGKVFEGYGDADPTNVNRMIAKHSIRMAETRAKARALRDLTNIGMTAIEELGGDDNEPTVKKPTAKELQDLFILSGSNKELMQQALERLGMKSSKDITKDNLFKVEAIVKEMLEA